MFNAEFGKNLRELRQAVVNLQEQEAERERQRIRSRAFELFGVEDITEAKDLSVSSIDRLNPLESYVDNRLAYDILEEVARRDTKYEYRGIFNMTIANPNRLFVGGDTMHVFSGQPIDYFV